MTSRFACPCAQHISSATANLSLFQRIDDYRHRMAPKSTKAIPLKWIQQNVLALLPEEAISSYEVLENLRDYAVKIAEAESTVSHSHRINPGKLYHSNQKHVAPRQRRRIQGRIEDVWPQEGWSRHEMLSGAL